MASSYLPSDYQRERERVRRRTRTVPPVSCSQTHGSISLPCIFQWPLGRQLLVSDLIEPSYTDDTAENLLSLLKTSLLWGWVHTEPLRSAVPPYGINYSAGGGKKVGKGCNAPQLFFSRRSTQILAKAEMRNIVERESRG